MWLYVFPSVPKQVEIQNHRRVVPRVAEQFFNQGNKAHAKAW
jgi:hypothetical protein